MGVEDRRTPDALLKRIEATKTRLHCVSLAAVLSCQLELPAKDRRLPSVFLCFYQL
nr:MAG TPA: hypothetical protein [Caudoviricetes sp.]